MKTRISFRLMTIAFVALFTSAFITPALANDEKKAIPVELKFIGTGKNNQPLFHLVFNSPEEKEFTIAIRDADGNLLYRDNVKGSTFIRKFLLNVEELDGTNLKFEVSGKDYKPVIFQINNTTRLVEDIVVNKVK